MKTLVSLFSSAGVGDYGFKMAGFETVVTNEILKERIEIQKLNNKCKYSTGYIQGDIQLDSVKKKIMNEIFWWKDKHDIQEIDVLVATPPCQGISTANFKKNNETSRNSLIIESLELIVKIQPRYFILENVKSFLKTTCLDKKDKNFKTIESAINSYLERYYNIHFETINFKNFGVPSSRPRTLVIGTRKDFLHLSPLLVFPERKEEITLLKSIGKFNRLNFFNELDAKNPLHMFREYPSYMREWISNLQEGESAFNSSKIKPYKIVDGKRIELKGRHLGNKFSRMFWNKPAPAIHTRSDQLASNRTIHPEDDRVLSITELMKLMTIPKSFKWFSIKDFKKSTNQQKFLKKHELKIRRSIGEAVPTNIFNQIAKNIIFIDKKPYSSFYDLQFQNEIQKNNAAFYTPQSVIFNIINNVKLSKKNISILEPSAGWGAFLPQLIKKFQNKESVKITLMDIDDRALNKGKKLFQNLKIPKNVLIQWKKGDFLKEQFNNKYDLVIGNPPYKKIKSKNLYNSFLNKAILISDSFSFIVPKTVLNSDADSQIRNKISQNFSIYCLMEFGTKTFSSVNIETIIIAAFNKSPQSKANQVKVGRYFGHREYKMQKYILLDKIWLPYRDSKFDIFFSKLKLDVFDAYRDRQITNKFLETSGKIRILKSKNVAKDKILNIKGYDKFINNVEKFTMKKFINSNYIVLPNFTYNLRAAKLPKNTIGNGSIVVMKNKEKINIKKVIELFNSDEYNYYYGVLQSFSKFTININKTIAYYMGVTYEKN